MLMMSKFKSLLFLIKKNWMSNHSHKFKSVTFEIMLLGSKSQLVKVNVCHINIGNAVIKPSETYRNLGVTFDPTMSMSNHVSNTC